MPWQPAREQEDGIDTDVVAGSGVADRESLGGDRDSPQPVLVERHGGALLAGTRLYLDEGQHPPAARDQVDLTAGHPGALGKNPPAVQAQPPGRQPLGTAPALFGGDPPVQRPSSSARA